MPKYFISSVSTSLTSKARRLLKVAIVLQVTLCLQYTGWIAYLWVDSGPDKINADMGNIHTVIQYTTVYGLNNMLENHSCTITNTLTGRGGRGRDGGRDRRGVGACHPWILYSISKPITCCFELWHLYEHFLMKMWISHYMRGIVNVIEYKLYTL